MRRVKFQTILTQAIVVVTLQSFHPPEADLLVLHVDGGRDPTALRVRSRAREVECTSTRDLSV